MAPFSLRPIERPIVDMIGLACVSAAWIGSGPCSSRHGSARLAPSKCNLIQSHLFAAYRQLRSLGGELIDEAKRRRKASQSRCHCNRMMTNSELLGTNGRCGCAALGSLICATPATAGWFGCPPHCSNYRHISNNANKTEVPWAMRVSGWLLTYQGRGFARS